MSSLTLDDDDREAMRAEFRRAVPPTAADFCRRWGVSASTFRRYRVIFGNPKTRLSTEPAPLLPVLGAVEGGLVLFTWPEEVPDGRS